MLVSAPSSLADISACNAATVIPALGAHVWRFSVHAVCEIPVRALQLRDWGCCLVLSALARIAYVRPLSFGLFAHVRAGWQSNLAALACKMAGFQSGLCDSFLRCGCRESSPMFQQHSLQQVTGSYYKLGLCSSFIHAATGLPASSINTALRSAHPGRAGSSLQRSDRRMQCWLFSGGAAWQLFNDL